MWTIFSKRVSASVFRRTLTESGVLIKPFNRFSYKPSSHTTIITFIILNYLWSAHNHQPTGKTTWKLLVENRVFNRHLLWHGKSYAFKHQFCHIPSCISQARNNKKVISNTHRRRWLKNCWSEESLSFLSSVCENWNLKRCKLFVSAYNLWRGSPPLTPIDRKRDFVVWERYRGARKIFINENWNFSKTIFSLSRGSIYQDWMWVFSSIQL